jgi:hypothetical protein
MEKPKRGDGWANKLNVQARREFDFVVPLSLKECQNRLRKQPNSQLKMQPETGEWHFTRRRDAGKNLNVMLDAYLVPLDGDQTHVYGEARIRGDTAAVLALFTVTHGAFVAMLVAAAMPPLAIFPPALMALFWHLTLKARAELIDDLMVALDVKIKRKAKTPADAEAE